MTNKYSFDKNSLSRTEIIDLFLFQQRFCGGIYIPRPSRKEDTLDIALLNHGICMTTKLAESKFLGLSVRNIATTLFSVDLELVKATFFKDMEQFGALDPVGRGILQWAHYLTTYGGFSFPEIQGDQPAIFANDFSFEQKEEFRKFTSARTTIKRITRAEFAKALSDLLTSGVALGCTDARSAVVCMKILADDIDYDSIQNREVKALLAAEGLVVPNSVRELNQVISYLIIGKTLFINSNTMLKIFHRHYNQSSYGIAEASCALVSFVDHHGIDTFAQQITPYRDFYMVFKRKAKNPKVTRIINRALHLSKKAKSTPMSITNQFFDGSVDAQAKVNAVEGMSTSVAGRIINSDNCRMAVNRELETVDSVPYLDVIRNGTTHVRSIDTAMATLDQEVRQALENKVIDRVRLAFGNRTENGKVYIPQGVVYPIATSARFLAGGLPFGTTLRIPRSGSEPTIFSVGVAWNADIDIDMHGFIGRSRIGWNSTADVCADMGVRCTYSGDMTRPNFSGNAAEYIRIVAQPDARGTMLLDGKLFDASWRSDGLNNGGARLLVSSNGSNTNDFVNPDWLIAPALPLQLPNEHKGNIFKALVDFSNSDFISVILLPMAADGAPVPTFQQHKQAQGLSAAFARRIYSQMTYNDLLEKSGFEVVSEVKEGALDLSPGVATTADFLI